MSADLTFFWEKVRAVGEILDKTGDYKAVAPTLREIVAIVQGRLVEVDDFEAAFIEILENPAQYSVVVVTYCMHILRLPNVRQHAEERWLRAPHRSDMHARHVLDAYQPEWPVQSLFDDGTGSDD